MIFKVQIFIWFLLWLLILALWLITNSVTMAILFLSVWIGWRYMVSKSVRK